jgi:zinc finger protein
MKNLFDGIRKCMVGDFKFTMIITDVLDNSFLQNPKYPEPDPNVTVEIYHRTEEDNDALGIDKMVVDNY